MGNAFLLKKAFTPHKFRRNRNCPLVLQPGWKTTIKKSTKTQQSKTVLKSNQSPDIHIHLKVQDGKALQLTKQAIDECKRALVQVVSSGLLELLLGDLTRNQFLCTNFTQNCSLLTMFLIALGRLGSFSFACCLESRYVSQAYSAHSQNKVKL